MTWRPSREEIETAARVLHKVGSSHHWWQPYFKSHDEMTATDPMAGLEFDGIAQYAGFIDASIGRFVKPGVAPVDVVQEEKPTRQRGRGDGGDGDADVISILSWSRF